DFDPELSRQIGRHRDANASPPAACRIPIGIGRLTDEPGDPQSLRPQDARESGFIGRRRRRPIRAVPPYRRRSGQPLAQLSATEHPAPSARLTPNIGLRADSGRKLAANMLGYYAARTHATAMRRDRDNSILRALIPERGMPGLPIQAMRMRWFRSAG